MMSLFRPSSPVRDRGFPPPPSWLPRLSERSRARLVRARDEAMRLWHVTTPEPEHLLLALLAGGDAELADVLPLGEEAHRFRSRLEELAVRERPRMLDLGDVVPVELSGVLPLTRRMRSVVEAAVAEADAAGGEAVEPVHLFLGILAEEAGGAAALLRELGLAAADLRERAGRGGGLAPAVDDASGLPIYEQIVRQVEEAVATGALAPGDRLPAVRRLADRLEIAPGTVARAYAQLEERGVVATGGPKGTRVAEREPKPAGRAERIGELAATLRPAVVAAFHRGAGADEVRRALEAAMEGILLDSP
ncbi:MAG TPA: GntR family transcriptional regulator, partial [Longimicrobiaceae bacterium]|nr:GntR family transcriptional regulator [Longimicrobiaceae bacterium]